VRHHVPMSGSSAVAQAPVTIVLNVSGGAGRVAETLESVVSQRVCPSQIIVVHDGCTDGLAAALDPYRGRITLIRRPHGDRTAAARNGRVWARLPLSAVDRTRAAFLAASERLRRLLRVALFCRTGFAHTWEGEYTCRDCGAVNPLLHCKGYDRP
jgi:hypothetical protein